MSGIGGILNLDGSAVEQEDLEALLEAIAHRGADRGTVWTDGCAGLAHAGSGADFARGGVSAAFDGRIDNLPLLTRWIRRDAARSSGSAGREHTEPGRALDGPEAVARAYELWGDRALPRLLGDFALCVWDGRAGRLVIARDPMGAKPLFYRLDGRRLIFASEAKGILAVPGVPCAPDPERMREFEEFRFGSFDGTFFDGIRRLLPGECITAENGSCERKTYWSVSPERRIRMAGRNSYRRRFRKLFLDAVRRRLPESGAAAVRLSGGLDSSAIAGACALIRDQERPALRLAAVSCLTDLFPDERAHISTVCREHRLPSHSFKGEDVPLLEGIERAVWFQENPLWDPIDPWVLHQHRLAKDAGAVVVLGGEWGDQVMVNGCVYLADLLRRGRWLKFASELRMFRKNEGGTWAEVLKPVLWHLVLPARIPNRRLGLRHILRRLSLFGRRFEVPGPAFPTAAQRGQYDAIFGIQSLQGLELLDGMAAQCGVEVRFPFLDRRLVAFMLAIPAEEKIRDGLGRRLEREALEGILPSPVAARRDKGDYTDVGAKCLESCGLGAATPDEALKLWRRRVRAVWEETWIRKKEAKMGNTRLRALSNTAA